MFRNAKVGDRVWDFRFGWGNIKKIDLDKDYPICVELYNNTQTYTTDGKYREFDKNPVLFWDEIKFEIPKKPFNLKEFLKENLEPKEFVPYEENYYLYTCDIFTDIYFAFEKTKFTIQPYFEKENIEMVCDELSRRNITLEQLKQAFKELGWL